MAYRYKGSINFGFVYIPITLHTAIKENHIAFHLLDKKTLSRVKYLKTCESCDNKKIKNEDIVKGYEYEEGKYVVLEEEDLEKIKAPQDKNIMIEQFIELKEIDPIYFDKAYFVVPTGAHKAFKLLVKAMEEEKKAGIAKTVIGTKESVILLRVKEGEMLLNTLHFHSEIQKNPCKAIQEKTTSSELKLAKTLIEQMTSKFEPEKYKDEYTLKIQKAIETKIQGKEIVSSKKAEQGNIVDLMEALQSSISQLNTPKKTKKTMILPKGKKERPAANA